MLCGLGLNTEVIHIGSGCKKDHLSKHAQTLATFESSNSAICLFSCPMAKSDRVDLPCTQALQVGTPSVLEFKYRAKSLEKACIMSGRAGRIVTLLTPWDHRYLRNKDWMAKAVNTAMDYQ
jgi:hypothetical protein